MQAFGVHSTVKSNYPFPARPPPQKKCPVQPLPPTPSPHQSRRESSTSSAIAAWAACVQPGSPASLSPRSPCHPSCHKSSCPSITFFHITPTPTTTLALSPSVRDFKPNLTTVGYTSVFLQLPNTPISATLPLSAHLPLPNIANKTLVPPTPACKYRSFTRFFRLRARSKSIGPSSSTKMKANPAAAIIKRKKAKYAMRPPPLVNEVALMQFTDGGRIDNNIKRAMEAQARALGAAGLGDVHRDGDGGIWWDQDEEWEYAHLLAKGDGPCPHSDFQWVTFGGNTSPAMADGPGEERRGSVSTQDSDLDPKYIVRPDSLLDRDGLALFGSAVIPPTSRKPPTSVISLHSRPRCLAQHLRNSDLSVDAAFSSKSMASVSIGSTKPKGKARRRPAPLKLSPPSPPCKWLTDSPIDTDQVREDFIAASFEPANSVPVAPHTAASTTPVDAHARLGRNACAINVSWPTVNDDSTSLALRAKPSVLNIMGIFRSARKEDVIY